MSWIKRISVFFLIGSLFAGCAALSQTEKRQERAYKELKEEVLEPRSPSPELENIKREELEEYVEQKGVIFAKTDFQGALETRYVKFLFEDMEDPTHKFQLHIGKESGQQTFPWAVKTVQPGYFFVELPAGRYKISSVSIPVGSTTATEQMDVMLEVVPDTICYAGTLKMVGTKEKIKLGGGLPVIKPGFEFTVEVLDEHEEGFEAFRQNYPDFPRAIATKLMQVNASADAAARINL